MDGIINVYKERGFTSHDVVAKLRGILKQKKIGHTGTLDPEAEGVLPVCLGKATKVCDLLTDKDKTYEAVMKLGIVTDTQDMTGAVLEEKNPFEADNKVYSNEEKQKLIQDAAMSFLGEYSQIPPMYSALKVNGKKLYELAREGKEVERKPRLVRIHELMIEEIDLEQYEVKMIVSCSKGTYIRTLCHDIGEKLGCGACMKSLKRTKVERFVVEESYTLSQIEEFVKNGRIEEKLLPVDMVFANLPSIVVGESGSKLIYNGNHFYPKHIEETSEKKITEYTGNIRVYDWKRVFIGVYEYEPSAKRYKPVKMFL